MRFVSDLTQTQKGIDESDFLLLGNSQAKVPLLRDATLHVHAPHQSTRAGVDGKRLPARAPASTQAIDAALEFASRHTPAAPLKPLMGLVLGLNRIWRTREEHRVSDLATRHAAELRELHALYRQV